MPALPELPRRLRKVRVVEVGHQVEAQPASNTLRDRAIPREVPIDLERECVDSDHHPCSPKFSVRLIEYVVDQNRHIVGDDNLEKQAVGDVIEPIAECIRLRFPLIDDLWHQAR